MGEKDISDKQVLKKLGNVVGALEQTSSQLDSVISQSHIDDLRKRISFVECEIKKFNSCNSKKEILEAAQDIEREFSGLRALIISSFVLSMVNLVGIIFFSLFYIT